MDKFRLKAFEEEFPLLKTFASKYWGKGEWGEAPVSDLYYIRVKRLDKEALRKIYYIENYTSSLSEIYEGEKAFCHFPQEGWVEVQSELDYESGYAHEDTRHKEGETPLEVIDRIGENPDLMLVVEYGIDTVNYNSKGEGITILKPAKGLKIEDLISKAKEKALDKVRAEANF